MNTSEMSPAAEEAGRARTLICNVPLKMLFTGFAVSGTPRKCVKNPDPVCWRSQRIGSGFTVSLSSKFTSVITTACPAGTDVSRLAEHDPKVPDTDMVPSDCQNCGTGRTVLSTRPTLPSTVIGPDASLTRKAPPEFTLASLVASAG